MRDLKLSKRINKIGFWAVVLIIVLSRVPS